jgi:hypothetical protein
MERGRGTVAQLVEAMRYQPEGRGFDSPWCHWKFSHLILAPDYGPVFDATSNRNECQEYFLAGKSDRCVGADKLNTFVCQLLRNLGASISCNNQALSRHVTRIALPFTIYG